MVALFGRVRWCTSLGLPPPSSRRAASDEVNGSNAPSLKVGAAAEDGRLEKRGIASYSADVRAVGWKTTKFEGWTLNGAAGRSVLLCAQQRSTSKWLWLARGDAGSTGSPRALQRCFAEVLEK